MKVGRYTLILSTFLLISACSKKTEKSSEPAKEEVLTHPLIAGVNWADARDNFVDGWIFPSGIEASDDYKTVATKANSVFNGIIMNLPGVNAVRLPVNPQTVTESWWNVYQAIIDQALTKNLKVILCCWEGSKKKDGKIDDLESFWEMWTIVLNKYGQQKDVYIEVFNEPYGYNISQLGEIYEQFLFKFPSLPRSRILLSGTGYAEDLNGVGADARFKECLLALHNYAFWNTKTQSEWEADWRLRYGAHAARTVVTEFGAGMTTGKNYTGSDPNDNEVNYIVGSTNVFRSKNLSNVYWPGIRDNDTYSLLTRSGTVSDIKLSVTNPSGVIRLRFGWGY